MDKFQFIVLFDIGNCRTFGATAAAGRQRPPCAKGAVKLPNSGNLTGGLLLF